MASEIRSFQVTIPAGTPISAPAVTPITFPPRTVVQVDWQVPTGPAGLMGWALTVAGQPVIPRNPGGYIVADGRTQSWQLSGYPDQGQWQVTGYNTDIYDHTVYLDFVLDQNSVPAVTTVQLDNSAISSPSPASPLTLPAIPAPSLAGL